MIYSMLNWFEIFAWGRIFHSSWKQNWLQLRVLGSLLFLWSRYYCVIVNNHKVIWYFSVLCKLGGGLLKRVEEKSYQVYWGLPSQLVPVLNNRHSLFLTYLVAANWDFFLIISWLELTIRNSMFCSWIK